MAQSFGRRLLHFPLTRIVIGTLVCLVPAVLADFFATALLGADVPAGAVQVISGCAMAITCLLAYYFLFKRYEGRRVTELSFHRFGRNIAFGLLVGVGMQCIIMVIIFLTSQVTMKTGNPLSYALPVLALSISSSVTEEILFRGILFRIVEEKLGSYIALLISGFIFGIIHMSNPNSSWQMGIAIFIEAGLMLGAAYMYSRNLWLPIAIHFAWNFTQGGIFGAAVSGYQSSKSLLKTKIEGNPLFTGGAFGPEGSIQAIVFGLVIFVLFMIANKKNGRIVHPFWAKRQGEFK